VGGVRFKRLERDSRREKCKRGEGGGGEGAVSKMSGLVSGEGAVVSNKDIHVSEGKESGVGAEGAISVERRGMATLLKATGFADDSGRARGLRASAESVDGNSNAVAVTSVNDKDEREGGIVAEGRGRESKRSGVKRAGSGVWTVALPKAMGASG